MQLITLCSRGFDHERERQYWPELLDNVPLCTTMLFHLQYCHTQADCTYNIISDFLFVINSKGTELYNYTKLRRKRKSLNNTSKVKEAADHSSTIPP